MVSIGLRRAAFPSLLICVLAPGCEGTQRHFKVSQSLEGVGGGGSGAVGPEPQRSGVSVGEGVGLPRTDGAGVDAGLPSCVEGSTEFCGPSRQEGICRFGLRTCLDGVWGACSGAVAAASRDCSSPEDNDCDGQPDDTIDEVCRCPVDGTRVCEEHVGLDGRGQCHAGHQTCVLGEGNSTSDWGTCGESVGPGVADLCTVEGDDTNCDGTPNSGCTCVEGRIVACGPDTESGICQRGTSTCTNGAFAACQGAVFPAARDCSSPQDNDCDGRSDNTIDTTCTCVIGDVQPCGTHVGLDGNGPCRAGQQRCEAGASNVTSRFGACTGSVGPALRDSCTLFGDDADCNGTANGGCQCIAGRGNAPCSGDADNARCSAQGTCAPCQVNADCSLISGGRTFCEVGRCTTPPVCGDGIRSGSELCDGGRPGSTVVGACNPECTGFYEERSILITRNSYPTDLGGVAGADAKCVAEFGPGFKAMIAGGGRRASVTPFLGDGQQDWVLHKYTHYLNSDGALIWRTDDIALLAASGGRRQAQFADLWSPNTGIYPWAGLQDDGTTFADSPTSQLGTCNGWTTNDNASFTRWASFFVQRIDRLTSGEPCGDTGLLLCVEQ